MTKEEFVKKLINDDDFVFERLCSDNQTLVKLLIDSISYQYLQNATIDYKKDLNGEHFIVNNPNAKIYLRCLVLLKD